ncbi:bacterial Ig-like domain-containing protein [Lactococcus formosensis]|uniref:Bacterial Ig-like domain-containing protein n=1 Tax=Lactococcus formosensis TaxID=1281486 RepID=A0A9X4P432_9LACT|nr:bacterial Ig-like domain-containing protein [Lactococcus formosensis]MDG6112559.1 bacterial Ig-like domain-containing protein [Lactococcus formosensis]MDG6113453.1 bacterial Ig-like domain-containing protein [Lactococcus formosensis]MDG6115693.1 bacterial Ig-like domain-containing protein [Lactococcus formosensis]MDG6118803.1 bacterial Ig-like domain-containing protein [Lactococcus formosensis]MDG6121689.1 bacterial Ig-like domain-containing protein [Lactococcus formosensis]
MKERLKNRFRERKGHIRLLGFLTVLVVSVSFLGLAIPKIMAGDTQVTDLTLQGESKEQLITLTLKDEHPEDTKIVIPLPEGITYTSNSNPNIGVTYDELSKQVVIDWVEGEEKQVELQLEAEQEGHYDFTARTVRDGEPVTSLPCSVIIQESKDDEEVTEQSEISEPEVPPISSYSSVGGGNSTRTIYQRFYDETMDIRNASGSMNGTGAEQKIYSGGKAYYLLLNTYPGVNKKTVKNSTYTIQVPDSIDFSSIGEFSLIAEQDRVFTNSGSTWLNSAYEKYEINPEEYTITSNELERTITVRIPNTGFWTPYMSTNLQFSYTAPEDESGDLTWKTNVLAPSNTSQVSYDLVDAMSLYHDVIIHHIDSSGNPLNEDTVVYEKFGTTIEATKYINAKEGYKFDHVEGETSATIDSDTKELTLVYKKKAGGNVTVRYIDENGNAIVGVSDQIIKGEWGDSYDAATPEYQISIPGYYLDEEKLPQNMTGKFDDSPKEVIYIYKKDKTVVNVHDSTLYVGNEWKAEENFDSALDKDGNAVDFKDIKVTGDVNTNEPGKYDVSYSYEGVQSKATITVKDNVLRFSSVPSELSFNESKISTHTETILRKDPNWKIIVEEDRFKKSNWRVTARLSEGFKDSSGNTLPDDILLFRKENQSDQWINSETEVNVFDGESNDKETLYDVSWGQNEGPLLQVAPGTVKVGKYTADITWNLIDAPA